jgi:hypothetical protein
LTTNRFLTKIKNNKMQKPKDAIDKIIESRLCRPGKIDWPGIKLDLAGLNIEIDRKALHRRVKSWLDSRPKDKKEQLRQL